jgi:hypothetical protein
VPEKRIKNTLQRRNKLGNNYYSSIYASLCPNIYVFWEVGGWLNESDAVPQSVFYKSAARRHENPAVILRVGYSSNNVITLYYVYDEWGKKTGHNRILIQQLRGFGLLSLKQLFHCRQYKDS